MELEAPTIQAVREVQHHSSQKDKGTFRNVYLDAVFADDLVRIFRTVYQLKHVLESRATTALHRDFDPTVVAPFLLSKLQRFRCRFLGYSDGVNRDRTLLFGCGHGSLRAPASADILTSQFQQGIARNIESKVSVSTHDITPPLVKNSISTKTGDSGETSLLYGGRVSKSNRRVEANGIGDEANSLIGVARAHCGSGFLHDELLEIQRLMFIANAEMTTETSYLDRLRKHFQTIGDEQIEKLDDLLRKLEEEVELPRAFIIPGASVASATLDVARCKVRELERAAVTLYDDGMLENPRLLVWLNRLSDCMFMMARYIDRELPPEIVTGTRRKR